MNTTTQPRLIALCSPAMGSGKSTIANHLSEQHGYAAVKFAAPLKAMTSALLRCCGVSESLVARYVDGDLKEEPIGDLGAFLPRYTYAMLDVLWPLPEEITLTDFQLNMSLYQWGVEVLQPGVTSRRIQQTLGTEWGRDQVHPQLWVLIAKQQVARLRADGFSVVIDDMRFPNELEAVREMDGTPLRVIRVGVTVPIAHASEGQLNAEPMSQLINDSTVEVLLIKVDGVLSCL